MINLVAYWGNPNWTLRKLQLLVASYLFYGAWNPPFVALLVISTAVDFYAGKKLASLDDGWHRKAFLVLSLCSNLGLLAWFKYAEFFLSWFVDAAALVGIAYSPPQLDILLPVGISFYTFQTLSYTIDLYRRKIEPCHSILDFALFVSFFPQLVAGPIVRAGDFLDQLTEPRKFQWRHWDWGMTLIVIGLFQKVVLADSLVGRIADSVFQNAGELSARDAWAGTLAFSWQILFDFAGYSTIAIGVAMMFGFSLPRNFHWPYAACGFSDFWRRWHISLSSWLRDYVYIPFGGNRGSKILTHRNLMLTMLLGGLWHGAAWTFVIWGAMHGALLIAERGFRSMGGKAVQMFDKGLGVVITFPLICFTWVFFRATSTTHAMQVCGAMIGIGDAENVLRFSDVATIGLITVIGLLLAMVCRSMTLEAVWQRVPRLIAVAGLVAMIAIIWMSPGDERAFIYFQF